MKFYKMINGQNFVGIGTSLDLRCYQKKHRVILVCDESKAQYLQYKDVLYRASWMLPAESQIIYTLLDIIEITETEYLSLLDAIEKEEEIIVESQEPVEEEIVEPEPEQNISLEYVKSVKIKEMSYTCNKTIIEGFSLVLSDGESHHFDLTIEDQVNLIDVASLIDKGETSIPYHASGEPFKFYSVSDIQLIIDEASRVKNYHTAYFNSLKNYINAIQVIEEVSGITYGVKIPEEYCSEVLIALAKEGE